ncbi:hypothetical protein [Rhizobium sp. 9140]|uniref:hypothetical protein n=1 Tax=Rhizobium sp. 9140 TaxID=1761900 RepID=UPI000AD4B272|nr:hypothetical protein [Rhizobium sp. 9140]
MIGVLDWLKLGVGATVGAALISGLAYLYGKSAGRQQAAVVALENSVVILRKRNEIDAEISRSDASELCRSLFLPDTEEHRECVRRVAEADTDAGNGGQDRGGR